ncbi:MAG: aspartate-semialdehyde dehydrogenase [Bacteroidetes bacterium GWC2_33_15]|nr:MAG: aspartate-semialdehyde dehydrogenase [Bacteroidetes bacterium GWA2_33_15]OFX52616.1 MAG: aspartate-semialdehyde dehydrogenase [Bacteroidetes bacterium GWC2_33_15]OFX63961.1 MAG: aspartate-semialdehyde dehydrogenase [Bacteroidetes bacterium GWB2_32_14]OFX70772.1 MAG: aspartate-semialdehyde dehydrogenase [Bacteroidetes bacterium GWD2_33_33]HAN19900.1 aspartate-semialdehyde dehydrogenase [Bacteroidales bacterium]
MKIAVVGATGLVGHVMLQVLLERKFPFAEVLAVASEKSIGKKINFNNKQLEVIGMKQAISLKPDIALFSAGGSTSLQWAPEFAKVGTTVIDNSSAWRMHEHIKLVVPEVNTHVLSKTDKIIANPNCSTIQLVVALAPLHKKYTIKRVVVSTYQSVTGTGVKAVKQLENERKGIDVEKAYPHPIDLNCFPHGGTFEENGYTTEETKLVNETRKIIGDQSIQVTATVVRIPVYGGHSEAVNIEFENDFDLNDVKKLLSQSPGITLQDEPAKNIYPMPKYSEGKDDVFVGRIRRDFSQPKTLNMWIVSDNLRKGAATNAVQIAEYLVEKKLV